MENNNHEDERAVGDKKDKEDERAVGDKKDKKDERAVGDKKDKEDERAIGDKKDKEDERAIGDKKDKDERAVGDNKDEQDERSGGDSDTEDEKGDDVMDQEEWNLCFFCMEKPPNRQGKVCDRVESKHFLICDECSSPFVLGYRVTNIEKSRNDLDSKEGLTNPNPFKCDVCGEEFDNKDDLLYHEDRHSVNSVTSGGSTNSPTYLEDEAWSISENSD